MAINHFEDLRCAAEARGMRDYERGLQPCDNPHQSNAATDERDYWQLGWDNARELDGQD